jgi:hypothetical protein
MSEEREDALIDRLRSTTTSLRNLFFINLLLAAGVLYLVLNDPGFVSERINHALQTFEPIFRIYQYVQENTSEFQGYRQKLDQSLTIARDSIQSFKQHWITMKQSQLKSWLKQLRSYNDVKMDILDSLILEDDSEPFFTISRRSISDVLNTKI